MPPKRRTRVLAEDSDADDSDNVQLVGSRTATKKPAAKKSSSSKKRRVDGQSDDENDDNNDDDKANVAKGKFETAVLKAAKAVAKDTAELAPQLQKEWPAVTKAMLDKMLDPALNDLWDQDDEACLSADWEQDEMREELLGLPKTSIGELLVVWRTVVQYFKCLPTDMINMEHHLAYKALRNKKGEAGGFDYPAWSSSFCKPLSRILLHPLWDLGQKGPLIMTLQFAVIVRTDDRRMWDFKNPTSSLFIERLVNEVKANQQQPEKQAVSALVQGVRQQLIDEGRALCEWAKLFARLVELVKEPGPTIWTGSFEEKPLFITTKDLETVETALEGLGLYGLPSVTRPATYRAQMISTRGTNLGEPQTVDDLRHALVKAVLKNRRDMMIRERVAQREGGLV